MLSKSIHVAANGKSSLIFRAGIVFHCMSTNTHIYTLYISAYRYTYIYVEKYFTFSFKYKYVQGSVSDYGKSKQSLWLLFLRTFQSYFKTLDTQSPFKIVNIIRLSVLTIRYLSQRGWVFVQPIPLNYFWAHNTIYSGKPHALLIQIPFIRTLETFLDASSGKLAKKMSRETLA